MTILVAAVEEAIVRPLWHGECRAGKERACRADKIAKRARGNAGQEKRESSDQIEYAEGGVPKVLS